MKTYVRFMPAGLLLGVFVGIYSKPTRTPGVADAAGNGLTTALTFGILSTAFGAVMAFPVRLLLAFRN